MKLLEMLLKVLNVLTLGFLRKHKNKETKRS